MVRLFSPLHLPSSQLTHIRHLVHVHISNLAAQTGASLFLHANAPPYLPFVPARPANWTYDKTENLSLKDLTAAREVTHLIAEADSPAAQATGWTPVAIVDGFDGWRLNLEGVKGGHGKGVVDRLTALLNILEMRRSTKLVIMKRAL